MKLRIFALIAAVAFFIAPVAHCQSDSVIHVNQFPGRTVADKVTNAMVTCPNAPVPCILTLDASLATAAQGTMPSLCSNCYLYDFRNGPPGAGGPIVASQVNNVLYASQCAGADAGAKIATCLASVANTGTVVADFSGAQTMSVNPFSGVNKIVTLRFSGCATYTLDAGIALNGTYDQNIQGAGVNCTILQDGANGITLVNQNGSGIVTDLTLTYNGHSSVVALSQHSNSLAQRLTVTGGFPQYAILRSGGPGTGVYSARTEDVIVNGTGSAPQYGLAEISSPVGYVGLNEDTNLTVFGTSVAAEYLDGGDSGGPTSCHNCDLGGNSGIGLWVENANAEVDGDCEGNTVGNVYVAAQAPPTYLNAASDIHCASAIEVYNSVSATGTIANSSNSMTISGLSGDLEPGVSLAVAGATFTDTSADYEKVTAVSGSTVTFLNPTTSSGGVSGARVYGPITPQWLQNDGTPTNYTTTFYTEAQDFIESPFIRRPNIEGIVWLWPELDSGTLQRWQFHNGLTDFQFVDSAYAPIADFNGPNHTLTIGSGGNTVYRCTTSGTLPAGALTVTAGNCGATADTGLRVP